MKTTVKLFVVIALTALIGFAACSNDPGNSDAAKDITWTAAANGEAGAVDTTLITFTFSKAVTGLTANNITLSPLTVSVTKGALSGGGTSWELGVTVINQGYITATIAKGGVSAAAKQVQVFKKAVNPVSSGGTSYINEGNQVVFAASTGNSGAYTLNTSKKDENGLPVTDNDNKWIWAAKAEGSYTWESSAQTITLTADKVADDDGAMTAKANALTLFKGWVEEEIEKEIEDRLKWSTQLLGETQDDAEAAVLEARNEENGTAYTTLDALIGALAQIRFDETFASRSYTYIFSSDGVSLILLEELSAPVGADELAGKTYSGTIVDFLGDSQKNQNHSFVFSAAGRTYTETSFDEVEGGIATSTGYYSYNSTTKRVYLKPAVRNGATPEQFYKDTVYSEEFDRYPSEADNRASQTHQHFKLWSYAYDPATNVVDTQDTGDLEPI